MIWSKNYWWLSADNLSNLDSPKNFLSSSYNLSLQVQNLATIMPKRSYSTSSVDKVLSRLGNIVNIKPIKFDFLEKACELIKFKYLGVSGVYKLTYKNDNDNDNDPSRFYIASSNNLARRMEEYNKLTKGLRNPHSASELEISKTSALDWSLEFIYITTPHLSLVFEQYAIIKLKPTINRYINVTPRVNPQWGDLDDAILTIENLLLLFSKGSEGYNRLAVFLKIFKTANNLSYTPEDIDNKYYSFLVYAYDVHLPSRDPIVYSSINRALKELQISYNMLLNYINNKYLHNSSLILSFEPLLVHNLSEYQEKPVPCRWQGTINFENTLLFLIKIMR